MVHIYGKIRSGAVNRSNGKKNIKERPLEPMSTKSSTGMCLDEERGRFGQDIN